MALAPSWAVETRVRTKTTGQGSVAGPMAPSAASVTGGPGRVELDVPSLGSGGLTVSGAPELKLGEPLPGVGAVAPELFGLGLPEVSRLRSDIPSAAPGEVQGRGAVLPGGLADEPGEVVPGVSGEGAGVETDEGRVGAGQALFDAAERRAVGDAFQAPGLWQKVKTYLRPDSIPSWPGKAGDTVRLKGTTYRLERKLGESHVSTVWSVAGDSRVVVKLVRPDFKGDSHYGMEVEALTALAYTGIPHARLKAASPDGLVLVKEFVEGETLLQHMDRGGVHPSRMSGLAALAGWLIAIGYTADLAPSNLIHDRWFGKWSLVDAGGFRPGPPLSVVEQLWKEELFGPDPAKARAAKQRFLLNLRTRLGPASPSWKELVRNAGRLPSLRKALEELAAFDAERPPPLVVFEAEAEAPDLSDRMVAYGRVTEALGYDPQAVKARQRLHLDDQGKLNTVLYKIEPEGRRPMVLKLADQDIIRRELAVRRIVRRWFSRYFATPRSLGWGDGMVMEFAEGNISYGRTLLDLPSRVAFAVLAHSFGLSDVNAGNVFYRNKDRAVLIDFEQSLHQAHPNFNRLQMEGIIEEMPWMERSTRNRIQDYLPAIAEWRKVFSKPETQKELSSILLESGFSKAEIPGMLEVFRRNAGLLELTVLADVEYANAFAESRLPVRAPSSSP